MKVNEILLEAPVNVDIDGVISQIKRNCQPFLSEATPPLWRGMSYAKNKYTTFAQVQTEFQREPRDTPPIINDYIVSWLWQKFGIPLRKEHTLFATGANYQAAGYGKPFMVFPIGNFQYCWSPLVKDLTDEFHHLTGQKLSASQIRDEVARVMFQAKYQFNTGLNEAVMSYKEIMIYCKSYYIFDGDIVEGGYTNFYSRLF